MVAIIRGTGDREFFTHLPSFILRPMFKLAMGRQLGEDDGPSLQTLVPTMRFDVRLIKEMAGRLESFRAVRTETLLRGGSKSAVDLSAACAALGADLPTCQSNAFPRIGH